MTKKLISLLTYLIIVLPKYLAVRLFVIFKPINGDKYFFISMSGNNYGDSIKCMSDYIYAHTPHAKIIWAFTKEFMPMAQCEHKSVIIDSFQFYYQILTSKYIIHNVGFKYLQLRKRKGQIVVNTWHGTALKKIGIDVYQNKGNNIYRGKMKHFHTCYNAQLTDIFVSGSRFMTNIIQTKLLFKKNIYEIGTPRNDIFFKRKPEIENKVRQTFGIDDETMIIMYAPTFRSDLTFQYYDLDFEKAIHVIEHKFNKSCCLLVRLHPKFIGVDLGFVEETNKMLADKVKNASSYPDMQELLYATDVLITDYSSSMFDFMYTKRLVILYAPDMEMYDRGFYFKMSELPFVVINSNNELEKAIMDVSAENYKTEIDSFIKRIGSVEDGKATERLYSILLRDTTFNRN